MGGAETRGEDGGEAPRCLCGERKFKAAPFCFACFCKLPISLKYDLATDDVGRRGNALRESKMVLKHIHRRPQTGRLF